MKAKITKVVFKDERKRAEMKLAAFIDFIRNFASANLSLYLASPEEYYENQYAIDREIASKTQYL